ncbi:MAG: hypothetical protein KAV18_05145, partial [Candidatus Omnitrophica bacterium]|nr:hypothetical protein [Candidatus Omnitrophota bacterium]
LFNKKRYKVYRLGGAFSFLLHLFSLTLPIFILGTDKPRRLSIYPKVMRVCNKLDKILPVFSCYYIVIVNNNKF